MSFLAPVLPFIVAGAGLLQAAGQYQQGQQAARASSYNADLYSQQAEQIRASAAADVVIGERQKESFLSSNRAGFAFRGVKISGSPLLVMAENAAALEADVRTQEYNTLISASRASSAASMEKLQARNYKIAGIVGAGTTILKTGVAMANFLPSKPSATKIATTL